jgi:hypothetical protein
MLAPMRRMGHFRSMKPNRPEPAVAEQPANAPMAPQPTGKKKVPETGGPAGPEPTRYGDWERGGRCVDF